MINLRLTSIRSALVVRFVAVATLPLLILGWFFSIYLVERQTADIAVDLQGHAQTIGDEVGEFIAELQYELRISRETIGLLETQRQSGIDRFLQTLIDNTDYFEAIYLLDRNGKVVHLGIDREIRIAPGDYLGADLSQLELLRKDPPAGHGRAQEFRWSDIFLSPLTGKPAIMLAIGVNDGSLVGTISLDRLNPILQRRIRQVETMRFALVDHHGALIAHSDPQLALERTNLLAMHPEILGALASGQALPPRLHEDRSLLESLQVIAGTGWIVHASVEQAYILAAGETLRRSLFSATLGAAVLGGVLAFWLARRLSQPLNELQLGAQALAEGDASSFLISRRGYDEIDGLASHLHRMAAAVTEREATLRAGEERYRSVVTGLGEGLLMIDPAGLFVDCNPAAERILNLTWKQLLGRPCSTDFGVFHYEDGTRIAPEEFPALISLRRGEIVENRLVRFVRHDGLELWLQINSRPILEDARRIAAALVTFTDVTAIKLVEESLRRGKERFEELYQQFQAVLEGIGDRISLISEQLHILWTNQEAGRGCTAKTSVSDDDCCYQQFFGRTEPCPGCPVVRCFATATPAADEVTDENERIWSLRAFPVLAGSGESRVRQVVLMAQDITEQRSSEQRQLRANQLASLGEVAAGVAHEINNPISGVINYAQLIVNYTPEESREHGLARRIIKEGDRIAAIVRELLIFARQESQEVQVVSVREALAEALTLCEAPLRKEQVVLNINLPPDLPKIESRSHQIQQVLLNLLVNARHALAERYPEGGADKLLRINGEVVSLDGRPVVRITVRDHGCGIPAELLPKVMNPFFTTKPAGVGTGLGLSVSFEIAKRHGGSLQLFSEHGQWTEAVLDLPAAPL